MSDFRNLHDIARVARSRLAKGEWDYLTGGAETETSLRRNRMSLDSLAFRPRVLNDVSGADASGNLLGHRLRIPVVLAPLGSIQLFDGEGAAAVARAASAFGTMMILSSVCEPGFEEVATIGAGPKIFQLYLYGDWAWMDDMIGRTVTAGYQALCITADTQVYSRRERSIAADWVPRASLRKASVDDDFVYQAQLSWATVEHIKRTFPIPLVIKGINTGEDARRAVDAGVDVIYVSNHGGRQLDHARGCIDSLPEVVQAVGGQVPVLVDGGFVRGTDVLKALCLGATAVGIGRLEGLAMAAGGEAAVIRMLELLEHEIRTNMALMGAGSVADLDPSLVVSATPLPNPHVLSAFPLLEQGY
jgi:isopentenyl diphosphate isomerase/L-lactate dehydrogenase-like FMN-dependent dehydrogenase